MTVGLIVLMAATFAYREFTYSRAMLLVCWADLIIFISGARFIINRIRFILRATKRDFSNLLLIGTGPTSLRLIKHIKNDPHWNYNVVGAVSVSGESGELLENIPVLGNLDQLPEILVQLLINNLR